jgi:formylglycine-generating enzyme required for sulfatase activity
LTVNAAPVITQQPQSKTVIVGLSVTFTVTATGNPSPTYLWRKNGTNISGTSDSFTISSVQLTDLGTYSVVVSNSAGSDTSVGAALTVIAAPASMHLIPGGTFQMGQTNVAEPVHSVTVSAFYMDTTEVKQADYQVLMLVNPSHFAGDSLLPVEMVTWFDAVLYCNKRSKLDSLDTVYSYTSVTGLPGNGCSDLAGLAVDFAKNGYRLPTEAEWEYACRAGDTAAYYWGGSYPPITTADTAAIDNNAVWAHNSVHSSARVGTKLPNAWGLYDMIGNVWEWCNDWLDNYTSGSQTDPTGPPTGSYRILRGGSWFTFDNALRSANRNQNDPFRTGSDCGFRCVRR